MRHGSLPTVENTILWYSMRMRHSHEYNDVNPMAEQRTRLVVLLTVVMMIIEISAGWKFKSMALLADGWHMSSHAIALGLSAAAYTLARRLARDERFAFGTWKIEILGGYTSAIFLVGVVIYMGWESVTRLFHPAPIAFTEAIAIASVGLLVNLCSAWLLAGAGGAGHSHSHADRSRSRACSIRRRSPSLRRSRSPASVCWSICARPGCWPGRAVPVTAIRMQIGVGHAPVPSGADRLH